MVLMIASLLYFSLKKKKKCMKKNETGTTDKLSGSDSGKSRRPEVAQRLQGSRDTGSKKLKVFFNGIAQKVFNRPEVTKIHLDVHGSYLWPFIDGERTVMDLAALEKGAVW